MHKIVFALALAGAGGVLMAACGNSEEAPIKEPVPTPGLDDLEVSSTCDDDEGHNCVEEHEQAFRMDDEDALGFSGLAADEQTHTISFDLAEGRELPAKLVVGAVVYRGRKDRKPFIARVDALDRQGAHVVLHVSKAGFKDAFKRGRIKHRIPLAYAAEQLNAPPPAEPGEPLGASKDALEIKPIGIKDCSGTLFNVKNGVVPPKSPGDPAITYSTDLSLSKCKFVLTAWVDAYLHWGGVLPDSLEFSLGGGIDAALHADFTFEGSASVSQEKSVWDGVPIPINIAGISITLTPKILAGYTLSSTSKITASAGFDYEDSLTVGFGWRKKGGWYTIDEKSSSFTPYGPTLSFNGNVHGEVFLKPRVDVLVFGFVGGYGALKAYASADVTGTGTYTPTTGWSGQVCTDLDVGLTPSVGATAEFLGISLFDEEVDLGTLSASLYNACTPSADLPPPDPGCESGCISAVTDCPFVACEVARCEATGAMSGGKKVCACAADPIEGCCTKDADCDDGASETSDLCVGTKCAHLTPAVPPEQPKPVCYQDADCADGDPLTLDSCDKPPPDVPINDGTCSHAANTGGTLVYCLPGKCNDGDPSTSDTCDEALKLCKHVSLMAPPAP